MDGIGGIDAIDGMLDNGGRPNENGKLNGGGAPFAPGACSPLVAAIGRES
jgi:hypothetical protein